MIRVVFAGGDVQAHRTLQMVLAEDLVVRSAHTGAQAVAMVRSEDPDVVLLQLRLPDCSGLDALRQILAIPIPPSVVMIAARPEIPLVVEAVRAGACDFIAEPYDMRQLAAAVRHAALARAPTLTPSSVEGAVREIVGACPSMERVRQAVLRFAATGYPVMIQGESGTGKELVARALHAASGRAGAFLALNCGALPDSLVESELFGTERGAFTDAASRAGLFEQADGGTLFLDEIGDMSPHAQARLLRILEQKEVTRLGGSGPRLVDVRILSASCRALRPGSTRLREDLFYRVGVLTIELPPLREHLEDLPLLCAVLLRREGFAAKRLSPAAMDRLAAHTWPGNIRELRNVLARAGVLSDGDTVGPEAIQLG